VAALHVGADGSSHVTIRLDPGELGQVQIRISRAQDGTSSVNVAVERPETLATLQGDVAHLHQALDRAGVPEQRSLSLQLDAGTFQPGNQSPDANAGFTPQGGSQQGARQDRQPDSAFAATGPASAAPAEPATAPSTMNTRLNTGINITA
jgi:flagellar hook-length control protein FliK